MKLTLAQVLQNQQEHQHVYDINEHNFFTLVEKKVAWSYMYEFYEQSNIDFFHVFFSLIKV